MKTEIRKFIGSVKFEKRSEGEDEVMPVRFGGEAAVTGVRTNMYYYDEEIAPGAFDNVISRSDLDVRVLFNHEECEILGRTTAGTARVWVNERGNLEYEWTPDYENPLHKQVARSIMRGDITQSSFQFTIKSEEWISGEEYTGGYLMRITEIGNLYDVAPVTFPAYEEATAEARSSAKSKVETLQHSKNTNDLDLLKLIEVKHQIK